MNSQFDGTVLELLGINLGVYFITLITFSLAYPWALVMKQRHVMSHTIVDGRRLNFDGTGGQMFGTWLKIALLTIITLGIYSFWAELTLRRWIVFHTHFDGAGAQVMVAVPVSA